MRKQLNAFKRMEIDKAVLAEELGGDIHNVNCGRPILVYANDVCAAIEKVVRGEKTVEQLVEWVNVIWFTELFSFPEKETDSIISVIDVLETLDEEGMTVTAADFSAMMDALSTNQEYCPA